MIMVVNKRLPVKTSVGALALVELFENLIVGYGLPDHTFSGFKPTPFEFPPSEGGKKGGRCFESWRNRNVLGFVDNTHASLAELFEYLVV